MYKMFIVEFLDYNTHTTQLKQGVNTKSEATKLLISIATDFVKGIDGEKNAKVFNSKEDAEKEIVLGHFLVKSGEVLELHLKTQELSEGWIYNDVMYKTESIGRYFISEFLMTLPDKSGFNSTEYLIEQGLVTANDNDTKALHHACKEGRLEIVKCLYEAGADIHAGNEYVLRLASQNGHFEVVKFLIEKGADIHAEYDYPLRWASKNGHFEIVKFLIEKGADIHALNDWALLYASEKGHLEVVKYLLEKGADIHANNDEAIRWASNNGHLEVVKYLLEKGADIHADDDYPLRYASQFGHLEVVKCLVEAGADIHANYNYALQYASVHGRTKVVEYLTTLSQDTRST